MSETATRRTTREKKPSRQYWYDEQDYSNLAASKPHEQKDKTTAAQETNFLAKQLTKFINSTNHKYRELIDSLPLDPNSNNQELGRDKEMQGLPVFGKTEGRGQKEVANDQKGIRPYQHDGGPSDSKPSRTDGKPRSTKQPKNTHQLAASLETDLTYHHALNEHVKNAYPNINSLSPDMLRDLSIPTEILSKPPVARPKAKEEKRTVVKAAKDENKPFKRQSYHVAIAYHIHLKQVKMSKTVEYVDPTYPARRLKDEEAKKV